MNAANILTYKSFCVYIYPIYIGYIYPMYILNIYIYIYIYPNEYVGKNCWKCTSG